MPSSLFHRRFQSTQPLRANADKTEDDDDDDDDNGVAVAIIEESVGSTTVVEEEEEEEDATQGPARITKAQLRAELKEYRQQQAAPTKKPAYTIFTNAALEGVVALLPSDRETLLQVKGIGPKKADAYGDDVLEIVSRYTGVLTPTKKYMMSGKYVPKPVRLKREDLTAEQQRAADLVLEDDERNVFLTGAAGTGKSHVLKYVLQRLADADVRVGVCAPTGVAAVNVGGSTLHSFFGVGLATGSVSSLVKKVRENREAVKRIDETDVLCVDECSMLSSTLLETLDAVVREVRHDGGFADEPFGGMRIVAVGDFFQLPPVVKRDDRYYEDEDEDGRQRPAHHRPFCFDSPVWEGMGLSTNRFELREVQRQRSRSRFVEFLHLVRTGDVTRGILRDFNAKCLVREEHPLPTDGIEPTRLYVLNRDVDAENESRLVALPGKDVIVTAEDEWREALPKGSPASLKKAMREGLAKEMPDEIRLRVGAQVMLTRNLDLSRNLVNGSRGVVERFVQVGYSKGRGVVERTVQVGYSKERVVPVVRFDHGAVRRMDPVEAVRFNPSGQQGCVVRKQIPLKLAWALTVHRSQGSTLSRALLDIGSAFEYGQCYVALSRVRDISGLWLEKPARLENIMVSPQVLDYYYDR